MTLLSWPTFIKRAMTLLWLWLTGTSHSGRCQSLFRELLISLVVQSNHREIRMIQQSNTCSLRTIAATGILRLIRRWQPLCWRTMPHTYLLNICQRSSNSSRQSSVTTIRSTLTGSIQRVICSLRTTSSLIMRRLLRTRVSNLVYSS